MNDFGEAARPGTVEAPRLITPSMLRRWPLPEPSGAKSSRGQVLVVGGAGKTPGGAMLSGQAALRMGAGRLTIACAKSIAPHVATAIPECGALGLTEDESGSVTGKNAGETLERELGRADAVLVGPGLDDAEGAGLLLEEMVPLLGDGVAVTLDAYGFTVLPGLSASARAALAGRTSAHCNAKELAYVMGRDVADDEVAAALTEVARTYGIVLSCQNHIVTPEGGVWAGSTGDTGLGTSGSGDVLAGAMAGLLSRGAGPEQSAVWATHVHASAGDVLAAEFGRVGFLAGELLPHLPRVMSSFRGD